MRTIQLIVAGCLLLASFYLVAKRFSEAAPVAGTWMLGIFLLLWLALSLVNMYLGISRAGYTFLDELPVFTLLFGVPALVALLLKWK